MRYLLELRYDGTLFYGSQKQKNKRTVCGELETVLSKIFNKEINLVSCSRTDKGVHANDFFVHFDATQEKDLNTLKSSLNKLISKDIYIKKVYITEETFHARYSVKEKEYVYKIYTGEYNPILRNYFLEYDHYINFSKIKKAAKELIGNHNFKAFTSDIEEEKCERKIKSIKIKKKKEYVYIYVKASGFLKYMVRNIIGLLLEINEGKKDIEIIDKLFQNKKRKENARCIDGKGLYLNKVYYR